MIGIIVAAVVGLFVVVLVVRAILVVHHGQAAVIERLGRFNKVVGPGLTMRIPMLDQVRARVDTREQVISYPAFSLATADNKTVMATMKVFTKIANVEAATYGTSNWVLAVEELGRARLTDLVGDLTYDENLRSRRVTVQALHGELAASADRWGILIVNVEVSIDAG